MSDSDQLFWKHTNLHSPEVTWQEEDDGDHTGDEASAKRATQQVDQNRTDSEEQVEEGRQRMPGTTQT